MWIYVDDKLPEPFEVVLILSADMSMPAIGWYRAGFNRWWNSRTGSWTTAQYWAPIPELPIKLTTKRKARNIQHREDYEALEQARAQSINSSKGWGST